MAQDYSANYFAFSDHAGTTQITYYPQAPGPLVQGQPVGPRLEYQGSEGQFTCPGDPGHGNIDVQEGSVLGTQINVVLVPTVDAKAVHLTLLLPPVNLAGKEHIDFHTLAIKTTSYGTLPKEGARLTYEVIHLRGRAEKRLMPRATQ